jgi:hypothetical protein
MERIAHSQSARGGFVFGLEWGRDFPFFIAIGSETARGAADSSDVRKPAKTKKSQVPLPLAFLTTHS